MNKVWIIILVLLLLTGCDTQQIATETPEPAYTAISEAAIKVGDPVPPPSGDIALTITGAIGQTNVDNTLQFDIETLEDLGMVEYSVDDKQAEGREAVFQGVLLSTLLDVAQVSEGSTVLHTMALNDYVVDIPIEDVYDFPVLLAVKVEGEYMTVERYGPTRVIYPYGSYDLDPTLYDPRWIWQLKEINVE